MVQEDTPIHECKGYLMKCTKCQSFSRDRVCGGVIVAVDRPLKRPLCLWKEELMSPLVLLGSVEGSLPSDGITGPQWLDTVLRPPALH